MTLPALLAPALFVLAGYQIGVAASDPPQTRTWHRRVAGVELAAALTLFLMLLP